jgi:hypothetical protein
MKTTIARLFFILLTMFGSRIAWCEEDFPKWSFKGFGTLGTSTLTTFN